MEKKYPASKSLKILTLGIKSYGAQINKGVLYIHSIIRKTININEIKSIRFFYCPGARRCGYFVKVRDKKELYFPFVLMEGYVLKELFNDLSEVNRYIAFDRRTNEFLEDNFPKKHKLKIDFSYSKGEFYKRDGRFIQRYPSLECAWILINIGFLVILPILFALLARSIFVDVLYPSNRIIFITLSALPLSGVIMNLSAALTSRYLGHKVTIISLAIFLTFIAIGLI